MGSVHLQVLLQLLLALLEVSRNHINAIVVEVKEFLEAMSFCFELSASGEPRRQPPPRQATS